MNMHNVYSVILLHVAFFGILSGQPLRQKADSSQAIADRIVESQIPVLVDFWAPWCAPCRMLNPIIHELEKKYNGKILFIKVNIDIHKALSAYFGVSSIPAIFIIKNKTVIQALPGVQPKETYISAIDNVLKVDSTSPQDTSSKKK